METLSSLGVLTFFVGIIAIGISFIVFLVAAISTSKKTAKNGLYLLLFGSVTLLVSVSLCSVSNFRI